MSQALFRARHMVRMLIRTGPAHGLRGELPATVNADTLTPALLAAGLPPLPLPHPTVEPSPRRDRRVPLPQFRLPMTFTVRPRLAAGFEFCPLLSSSHLEVADGAHLLTDDDPTDEYQQAFNEGCLA